MLLISYLLVYLLRHIEGICVQGECKNGGVKIFNHKSKFDEEFSCLCNGTFIFGGCCQYVKCRHGKYSESLSRCVCDPNYNGITCDNPDCGANGFLKFIDYTGREPCQCHSGWTGRFCEEPVERIFSSTGRANHLYFRSLLGLGSLLFAVCMCSCWFARRNLLRHHMFRILQSYSIVSSSNGGRFSTGNNVILTYNFTTATAANPIDNSNILRSSLVDRPPSYERAEQLPNVTLENNRPPKPSGTDHCQSDLPPSYEEAVRHIP